MLQQIEKSIKQAATDDIQCLKPGSWNEVCMYTHTSRLWFNPMKNGIAFQLFNELVFDKFIFACILL